MYEKWTRDLLAEQLHTLFPLTAAPGLVVDLELIDVSPLRKLPRQEAFSIVFRGPLDKPLGQGMYPVDHAALGAVNLFIVPIGREPDGMRYEAVFNHLVGP